jgi:putative two-component system response regulator
MIEDAKKILVVDDSKLQVATLTKILQEEGYMVSIAGDGVDALQMLEGPLPDLIISDVWMPKVDGYELCRTLKTSPVLGTVPIILLTSMSGFDSIIKGLKAGADYYLTKPYSKELLLSMVKSILSGSQSCDCFNNEDVSLEPRRSPMDSSRQIFNFLFSTYQNLLFQNANLMQTKQELKKVNNHLEKKVEEKTDSLQKTLDGIVIALSRVVGTRDPYTAGHQLRVAQLAKAIGQEVSLSQEQNDGIQVMGLLHDIGKIIVPPEILCKPGELAEYELHFIREHSKAGYNILEGIEFPWPVAMAVLQHHERMNGTGYPAGLFGNEIIVEAKILAVADVIESMASHRPYRPALGIELALKEISDQCGILYDPVVVGAATKLFREKAFSFK